MKKIILGFLGMMLISTSYSQIYWDDAASNYPTNVGYLGTSNVADLIFKTNATERIKILSTGNIGIGTVYNNNPTATLEIFGHSNAIGSRNFKVTNLAYNDLSGTELSALSFLNTNGPITNWAALYANSGTNSGNYAGWFDGNVKINGKNANVGDKNFMVEYPAGGNLSGTQFSALTYLNGSGSNTNWTALYANSGTNLGNYAGWFDGKLHVEGDASIGINSNSSSTIIYSVPTFEVFGKMGNMSNVIGGSNFKVTYPNIIGTPSLTGTEFSALKCINFNGITPFWTAMYAKGGSYQTNYAGYFDGNVGIIGNLKVQGKIDCQELYVLPTVAIPDYVFEKDYKLMKLSDIEKYINEYKHLPEVPSADEFKQNGNNVGNMNLLLLKKVEELTLYMIEQQKIIEKNNEEIKQLKSALNISK